MKNELNSDLMKKELNTEVNIEQGVLWSAGEEQEKSTLMLGQAIERYMEELRSLERRIENDQADESTTLRDIVTLNDTVLKMCAQFETDVKDEDVIKATRSYFRKRTHPILSKSYGINRIRTWPQGYQGDFKTLEGVYRDTPMSDGIGYYLDKYSQNWTLAHALRGRIEKLTELLRAELSARQDLKVLDIACGSCREVSMLVPDIKQSKAQFTCTDLDGDALDFAVKRLTHVDLASEQVKMTKYNALRMFDLDIARAEFGPQDIIYSVGYFDYLPDDFLAKLLRSLYQLLNPGGKLIAAFKDADRYRSQEYHWIADWDGFLQRTVKDFERILSEAGIPADKITMTRDRTGVIVFYSSTR
jgi:extracellular factor (EF) 3-hydroxypalmitic acid methyl ester biosynthesis protein